MIAAGLLTTGSVMLLSVVAVVALMLYGGTDDGIPSGVTVAGISIGGKSAEQTAALLEQQALTQRPVQLTDEDRHWTLTLAELGVGVDIRATTQSAQDAAPGTSVAPAYTIDLVQTQAALMALSPQINVAAVPGDPPQIGRSLDIPMMLSRLYENLPGELADGVLDLSMIVVQPPEDEAVTNTSGATTVHVVEQGQELALIARLYGVGMQDIVAMNGLSNPDLLYVGQELVIPADGVYVPGAADAPTAPTSAGKAIVVSTQQQRIYAYENGTLVHSYLASTGLPETPTVLGDYAIYRKYAKTDMRGPDYYLPDVPYTMYFYQGYGIHGTYWHNSFGRPMSHGCVNLPTGEAEWFFNWADVGTPVRVI